MKATEQVVRLHELLSALKGINDFYHASQSDLYRDMNRIDMSVIGFAVNHSGLTIKEIREKLSVPQSTLSSSISRLSKKGILRRVINERDSRSFYLEVTDKGHALLDAHKQVNSVLASDLLDALDTDEERETFLNLMAKVIEGLA